jgi:hypothetical protein
LASKHFIAWVERQAQKLRGRLRLAPTAPLDPFILAQDMKVQVLFPTDVHGLSPTDRHQLLITDADCWSAGALLLPNGKFGIILNPTHADTRTHATLMEELAHIYLKHKPSKFVALENGVIQRSFKKSHETEAYWVGAAALVPLYLLKQAKANGKSRTWVAQHCRVSVDLVKFRGNLTGAKL